MCGVCGFLAPAIDEQATAALGRMTRRLRHRGPDGSGTWIDPTAGIALGHTRLAVLDLSAAGRQPMTSADGRWVISYNGEIYNAPELRLQLVDAGVMLRGHSDTEVLVETIALRGVKRALGDADGMFAFAVWDRATRTLTLARDRLGKKPLYYGRFAGRLLFASELKAFHAHPAFAPVIDRDALATFLRLGWLAGPVSIYRGVLRLPPASLLVARASDGAVAEPRSYWSLRAAAERPAQDPFRGSLDDAVAVLDELLRSAVRARAVADVPLGALLSGGVDSTLVAALLQQYSARPVRTFTVGFDEPRWDEAPAARATAAHLGSEHTEFRVTARDALDVIPDLPRIYDEPLADPSQIPTALVCRLARAHVTVALSGDGGDETFGGYGRYRRVLERWRRLGAWPAGMRRIAAAVRQLLAPDGKLASRLQGIELTDPVALYGLERSRAGAAAELVLGARSLATRLDTPGAWPEGVEPAQVMMFLDLDSYLPDNNLVKIDRASMAVGLEIRSPLLDRRVVEFGLGLPVDHRLAPGQGKLILWRLLDRYLPRELTDRPKRGFGVPLARWLDGPLRDWAESLLGESRLRQQGLLQPRRVRALWEARTGRRGRTELLWHILMFQAWHEQWRCGGDQGVEEGSAASTARAI